MILLFTLVVLSQSVSLANGRIFSTSAPQCSFYLDANHSMIEADSYLVPFSGNIIPVDVATNRSYMLGQLDWWTTHFNIAGDPLFSPDSRPLCLGVYDDLGGGNAKAFSNGSLVIFGAELMVTIALDFQLDFRVAMDAVLAHELAHTMQFRKGIRFNFPLQLIAVKYKELQADCVAGALLGIHNKLNDQEILEAARLMTLLGDPGFVGDHGLPEDRVSAFFQGFEFSLLPHQKPATLVTTDDLFNHCSFQRIGEIVFPRSL